jgi:hypothetical protein
LLGPEEGPEENVKPIRGKQCQKCSSKNVYLEHDLGQWYEHCLICGYIAPLEEMKLITDNMVNSAEKQKKN